MGGGSLALEIRVGGRGLEVQEIREEGGGGQKLLPSVGGFVDFFWNNPLQGSSPFNR